MVPYLSFKRIFLNVFKRVSMESSSCNKNLKNPSLGRTSKEVKWNPVLLPFTYLNVRF